MTVSILVVDDEQSARRALGELLRSEGYDVDEAQDGVKALASIQQKAPDIVLTDVRMPLMDGLTLLEQALEHDPELCVVMMTAHASIEKAVSAMKRGAYHYLTKPLNFDEVSLQLKRCTERVLLQRALKGKSGPESETFETSAKTMRDALDMVDQVAPTIATVLLRGESGTGKEVIARRIHDLSPRANQPFVAINCASIPNSILESELFGHEKGSFTGAESRQIGLFEAANGGTIFLDEIGEVSPEVQVSLLRVLQEREVKPVGANAPIAVDVRVIAATNKDLQTEVDKKNFREDLYYRLNVISVELPPLRERKPDIPHLVRFFISRFAKLNEKSIEGITADAMRALESHGWPGNVRELQNAIERAVVLCREKEIGVKHLPPMISEPAIAGVTIPGATMEEIEQHAILETYKACGGDTGKTADVLDISRRKVQYRLKEYREKFEVID